MKEVDIGQLAFYDPGPVGRRLRVGDRMRRCREEAGLTQVQAAEKAGVSERSVRSLETGGVVGEEVWRPLHDLYGWPDPYPEAPLDPVRRMEWFNSRPVVGVRPRDGLTFGKG